MLCVSCLILFAELTPPRLSALKGKGIGDGKVNASKGSGMGTAKAPGKSPIKKAQSAKSGPKSCVSHFLCLLRLVFSFHLLILPHQILPVRRGGGSGKRKAQEKLPESPIQKSQSAKSRPKSRVSSFLFLLCFLFSFNLLI